MEHDPQSEVEQQPPASSFSATRVVKTFLTGVIVVSIFAVGYLSYTFVSRGANAPPSVAQQGKPRKVIQLDVLNGSGAKGLAAKCMNSLRSRGFDVVEMKNYKVSNIPHTLVVDRIGDGAAARQVASALGVPEKNVIEQLNPDYFVDVSVIIGGDYTSLQPSRPPPESR